MIEGIFLMIWQALAMYGFCHLIRPLVSEELNDIRSDE